MGIKNLQAVLGPELMQKMTWRRLAILSGADTRRGKNAAATPAPIMIVDLSVFMYRWAAQFVRDKVPVEQRNYAGNAAGLARRLIKAGFEPIFVADGKASSAKAATLAARTGRRRFKPDWQFVPAIAAAMASEKVRFEQAPAEADVFIAELARESARLPREVWVLSVDTDYLALGLNLARPSNESVNYVVATRHSDIMAAFRCDREQFLELCLALGTDYSAPILGATKAIGVVFGGGLSDEQRQKINEAAALWESVHGSRQSRSAEPSAPGAEAEAVAAL